MDIIKNSRLIAKYLGWKYVPFEPSLEVKAGWYKPSIGYSKGPKPHKDGKFWEYVCRNHNQLRFYNSFDALIPAINSLESEELEEHFYSWEEGEEKRYNFINLSFAISEGTSDFCIYLELGSPIIIGEGGGKGIIKDTFKAIVETIKFVNDLKKNKK